MSLRKTITTQDEEFVALLVEGKFTNMDCYLMAYPEYEKRTKGSNESELSKYLRAPKIVQLIAEYREEIRQRSMLSLEYMLEKCREMIEAEDTRNNDRIKSMELAAKLQGMFEKRVTLQGGLNVTHDITPEMSEALDDLLR